METGIQLDTTKPIISNSPYSMNHPVVGILQPTLVISQAHGKKVKKNGKVRKNEDYWVFSVYNAYNRRNPFSIYFAQADEIPADAVAIPTQATRVAIIGSIVPAVSYNFKF